QEAHCGTEELSGAVGLAFGRCELGQPFKPTDDPCLESKLERDSKRARKHDLRLVGSTPGASRGAKVHQRNGDSLFLAQRLEEREALLYQRPRRFGIAVLQ